MNSAEIETGTKQNYSRVKFGHLTSGDNFSRSPCELFEHGYLRPHPLLDPELIGTLRNRWRKFFWGLRRRGNRLRLVDGSYSARSLRLVIVTDASCWGQRCGLGTVSTFAKGRGPAIGFRFSELSCRHAGAVESARLTRFGTLDRSSHLLTDRRFHAPNAEGQATAAAPFTVFAAPGGAATKAGFFSTLSISTLRCRPFSRGSSTSSPSSAPRIALPSGELTARRPFLRSLPLSDQPHRNPLLVIRKTSTTLSPSPIPAAAGAARQRPHVEAA